MFQLNHFKDEGPLRLRNSYTFNYNVSIPRESFFQDEGPLRGYDHGGPGRHLPAYCQDRWQIVISGGCLDPTGGWGGPIAGATEWQRVGKSRGQHQRGVWRDARRGIPSSYRPGNPTETHGSFLSLLNTYIDNNSSVV